LSKRIKEYVPKHLTPGKTNMNNLDKISEMEKKFLTIFNFYSKNIEFEKNNIDNKKVEENFNRMKFKIFKVEQKKIKLDNNPNNNSNNTININVTDNANIKKDKIIILKSIKHLQSRTEVNDNIRNEIKMESFKNEPNADSFSSTNKASKQETKSSIINKSFSDDNLSILSNNQLKPNLNNLEQCNIQQTTNNNNFIQNQLPLSSSFFSNTVSSDYAFLINELNKQIFVNDMILNNLNNLSQFENTISLMNRLYSSYYSSNF
jgi:hypothetical protein